MDEENQSGISEQTNTATSETTVDAPQEQPSYQRVTAEEAATLDFSELKKRMREEARLASEGRLPEADADVESASQEDDEDGVAGGAERRGTGNQRSEGQQSASSSQGETELQALLRQAQERTAALERESRENRERQERAELVRQHREAEQRIAQLPNQQQQELARLAYRNSLQQAALNDYTQYLQQRETAVQQAEFTTAKRDLPGQMREVADFVAQNHGIKAEALYEFVDSPQARQLIQEANNPNALIAAAASLGQLLDWQATREAGRLAAQREQRRKTAPRQMRDTPVGGVPPAGGGEDEARRIENLSREDFMKYRKEQLRLAAQQRA